MARMFTQRRVLLATLAIGGLLAIALWPTRVPVELATASRGPLVVTVDEEGRTRVRDRFVVSAPVTGRVLRLELEPGDRVKRGDIVARVQPEMPPLLDVRSQAEAEAAVESARAALGRARAEEQRAQAALALADRELSRSRRLEAAGVVPEQDVATREADARLATEATNAAAFAVRAAAADVQRAEARLIRSPRAPSSTATVTAPVDGVILRRLRESENVVPAGEALVEIADPAQLEVVVDLLSTDAMRVKEGARAIIEPSAGQGTVDATVRRIEPAGFTKISALGVEEQRVNVVLDLANGTGEDLVFGDAYRVDVRIVIWESPNVLKVPTSALVRDTEGWAVFEVRDGRAHRTLVELGRQTGQEAEVVSGLEADARVIVHPPDSIVDGVRVQEAPE